MVGLGLNGSVIDLDVVHIGSGLGLSLPGGDADDLAIDVDLALHVGLVVVGLVVDEQGSCSGFVFVSHVLCSVAGC